MTIDAEMFSELINALRDIGESLRCLAFVGIGGLAMYFLGWSKQ
jgi:hypothetical protein